MFSKEFGEETLQVFKQLPGFTYIKDLDLRFVAATTELAGLLGFKHPEDLEGRTDRDLNCKASENADIYMQQDRNVIASRKVHRGLCIDRYANDELRTFAGNKKVFRNQDGESIGIIVQAIDIQPSKFIHAIFKMTQYYKNNGSALIDVSEGYPNLDLSKRETQCFFYLLHGKSASDIGKILNLSQRTVESYIENIKLKMFCQNKKELFDKAHELGFHMVLPIDMLPKDSLAEIR